MPSSLHLDPLRRYPAAWAILRAWVRRLNPMPIKFLANFLRGSTDARRSPRAPVKSADTRFRAVSIRPGEGSCEAARQLAPLRFLYGKSPALPLPECDAASCTCRYVHFSDRRSGVDRRAAYDWERERSLTKVNRRLNNGRRSTDSIA
jgi:hypothetical protein